MATNWKERRMTEQQKGGKETGEWGKSDDNKSQASYSQIHSG